MEKKKVDVKELRIGMYVDALDRPWLDSPFLFQGFPIRSQEEIRQLQESCQFVYIDLEKTQDWKPEKKRPDAVKIQHHIEREARPSKPVITHRFETQRLNIEPEEVLRKAQDHHSFLREVKVARQVHHKTHNYINTVLEDVRLGRSIDPEGAKELVNTMADSIISNENALVWLTQLQNRDEYTSLHSINVCILSLLFGRHLGLKKEELQELGFGALLHDIGKMKVPLEVLNKPGELNDEELALLKEHPQLGYDILAESKKMSGAALDIARSHHERVDGSGYPRGLEGDEISYYAMLVSVVDVYDAITSDRVYHMGISPHEALSLMYEWAPKSFRRDLLEAFIKCLGIYPIGSIVELSSGEVGVVMTVNRAHHLKPIVMLVLDKDKQPYAARKLINLELYGEQTGAVNIRKILESNAYGIDVRQLILGGQATSMAS